MNKEEKELLAEIKQLHKEVMADYQGSLSRCIKLGEILKKQKNKLPHGHFIRWVTKYLPFSERTARNYIALDHHKGRLLKEKVNSLHEAYKLISDFRIKKLVSADAKKLREKFANSDDKYINPRTYINKVVCGDNCKIMQQMINKGMKDKYTAVITSPPYNAGMQYGKGFNDSKPYPDYLEELLKPFALYYQLLRVGGRVIYIVGSLVGNKSRDKEGDYNHQLITDITYRVRADFPEFRLLTNIIWSKGDRRKNPLNTRWGSFCSPSAPLNRTCNEHILIWSKEKFELVNIEQTKPDITEEQFKEWAWSVWNISPYTPKNNPHPCSFPPKLIDRLIKFYTYPNDLILDSHAGAGVTAQMCKKHHRRYTMIELNPSYCKFMKSKLA